MQTTIPLPGSAHSLNNTRQSFFCLVLALWELEPGSQLHSLHGQPTAPMVGWCVPAGCACAWLRRCCCTPYPGLAQAGSLQGMVQTATVHMEQHGIISAYECMDTANLQRRMQYACACCSPLLSVPEGFLRAVKSGCQACCSGATRLTPVSSETVLCEALTAVTMSQ